MEIDKIGDVIYRTEPNPNVRNENVRYIQYGRDINNPNECCHGYMNARVRGHSLFARAHVKLCVLIHRVYIRYAVAESWRTEAVTTIGRGERERPLLARCDFAVIISGLLARRLALILVTLDEALFPRSLVIGTLVCIPRVLRGLEDRHGCDAMRRNATRCNTTQYNAIQRNAMRDKINVA